MKLTHVNAYQFKKASLFILSSVFIYLACTKQVFANDKRMPVRETLTVQSPLNTDTLVNKPKLKVEAADSSVVDKINHLSTFYGKAKLSYGTITITADKIVLDEYTMQVHASKLSNSKNLSVYNDAGKTILKAGTLIVDLKTKAYSSAHP